MHGSIHSAFIAVPSTDNIKMQCKQTWDMLELTIFIPWLIREGFIQKPEVSRELLKVHFMPDRSAGGRRKCHNKSGRIPKVTATVLLWEVWSGAPHLWLSGARCTHLAAPIVWSQSLQTIRQKGWTLVSLFCIFKDYCHFLMGRVSYCWWEMSELSFVHERDLCALEHKILVPASLNKLHTSETNYTLHC